MRGGPREIAEKFPLYQDDEHAHLVVLLVYNNEILDLGNLCFGEFRTFSFRVVAFALGIKSSTFKCTS